MATSSDFHMETNAEMYSRAKILADEFGLEKKERVDFIEQKVKEWTKEQKEYLNNLADRERDERAAKRAHEIEIKDKELEIEKEKSKQNNIPSTSTTKENNDLKRIKISYFDGKNIDAFFKTFEMQLKAEQIQKKDWHRYLFQSVKDKARTAMSYINIEDCDYDEIKRQMLAYFIKTPNWYRERFNNAKLDQSHEPTAFVKDIQHYLITWLELMKVDLKDPNQIIEMIIYDKILSMASTELFTYLKEKEINNIDKLISAITSFKDSHPNSILSKENLSQSFNFVQNDRRSQSVNTRRDTKVKNPNVKCFYCQRSGHIESECLKKIRDKQNNANETRGRNRSYSRSKQKQSNNSNNNKGRFTSLKHSSNNNNLIVYPAFLGKHKTHCLRDTACTTVCVDENLIQRLGHSKIIRHDNIMLGNGYQIKCPIIDVYIDTPWFTGMVEAAIVKSCIAPIIIGNIPNIKPDNSKTIFQEWLSSKNFDEDLKPGILGHYIIRSVDTVHVNSASLMNENGKSKTTYKSTCTNTDNDNTNIKVVQTDSTSKTVNTANTKSVNTDSHSEVFKTQCSQTPKASCEEKQTNTIKENFTSLHNLNGTLYLFPAFVNGIEVMSLRDTGCSCLIVQKNLVLPNQYIDEFENITLGDGSSVSSQCAIVNIDTPWISGDIKACVLENCTAPLIIGNLTDIKPDNFMEVYHEWIEQRKLKNINKPKTIDEYHMNPIETLSHKLNLLKVNNVDQNKWTKNLPTIELVSNCQTTPEVNLKFHKWNGTEMIVSYIENFENICNSQNISKELMSILLAQHLDSNKKAFQIANNNLDDYEIQKTELIKCFSRMNTPNKIITSNENENDAKQNIQSEVHEEKQKVKSINFCNITNGNTNESDTLNKINHEILLKEQNNDPYIMKLKNNLNSKTSYNADKFKFQNDIMIRIVKTNECSKQQIIIPKSLTNLVISAAHDNPLSAHQGFKKTLYNISKHFWWKCMKVDIKKYIDSCHNCQVKNKIHNAHIAPLQKVDNIVSPFHKIAIDIIGPMTTTRTTKSRFALVVIDLATRWIEIVPLRFYCFS